VFTNVTHPRAHVARKPAYETTVVGRGATIGANATIVCGVSIGAYAMIGAGAVVTRDVPAHGLVIGAPARRTGWVCRCGETLGDGLLRPRAADPQIEHDRVDLPASVRAVAPFTAPPASGSHVRCGRCGDRYALSEHAATLLAPSSSP